MKVAICQPHFFPFIGYFDLIANSDIFVFYDNAQYVKRWWHSRCYLSEKKQLNWFSIPIGIKGKAYRSIADTEIHWDGRWIKKSLKRLNQQYGNALKSDLGVEILHYAFDSSEKSLASYNIRIIQLLSSYIGLKTSFIKASDLRYHKKEKASDIIAICKEIGATEYVCGSGSKFYIQDQQFLEEGLKVNWLNYNYPNYTLDNYGQKSYSSILDDVLGKHPDFVQKLLTLNLHQ